MKKILVLSLLLMFGFTTYVEARNQYDETGRNLIYDGTIRGRKRARIQQAENQRKMQAAAAAKLNYEEALKRLDEEEAKNQRK